jgi:heme exporter protein B
MIATLLKAECLREIKIAFRKPTLILTPLSFYVLTSSIVPLSLDVKQSILQLVAPGIIWLLLVFSLLLSQQVLFARDYQGGVLEQLLLIELDAYFIALARLLAYLLVYALPLLLTFPLMALMWRLTMVQATYITATLVCGLPTIVVLLGLLNALTLGNHTNSGLVPLLLLPLMTPTIIFATGSVALISHQSLLPYLLILSSISLVSLALGPLLIGLVIRHQHY